MTRCGACAGETEERRDRIQKEDGMEESMDSLENGGGATSWWVAFHTTRRSLKALNIKRRRSAGTRMARE